MLQARGLPGKRRAGVCVRVHVHACACVVAYMHACVYVCLNTRHGDTTNNTGTPKAMALQTQPKAARRLRRTHSRGARCACADADVAAAVAAVDAACVGNAGGNGRDGGSSSSNSGGARRRRGAPSKRCCACGCRHHKSMPSRRASPTPQPPAVVPKAIAAAADAPTRLSLSHDTLCASHRCLPR